jgi:hypothetical protein
MAILPRMRSILQMTLLRSPAAMPFFTRGMIPVPYARKTSTFGKQNEQFGVRVFPGQETGGRFERREQGCFVVGKVCISLKTS